MADVMNSTPDVVDPDRGTGHRKISSSDDEEGSGTSRPGHWNA
jgi:hypothetical protein